MNLYNTLSRTIEPVKPLSDNTVKLYTCGLTVYSQPHIGNWSGYIYWDVLVRALKAEGFEVERVQNITDVGHLTSDEDSGDDKMEKGARREGVTAWDVASKYISIADHEAYDMLDLVRPDHMPRATDYIAEQIAFVQTLVDKDFTYTIPDDGIYFDTSKLDNYGALARLDIEGLQAGARVPVDGKRNITDFALWKFSHAGQKRDMEWESPWGIGFPGWHLECSVMAREILGDQIDIHTGGIDHIPVHHTNEIAQTEAVTGTRFSQLWAHNNHIKVDGGKMSKSLGNIYTLQDILDRGFSLEAFKLMVLSSHYQTEGNFTWEILEAAQNRLKAWESLADLRWQSVETTDVNIDWEIPTLFIREKLSDNLNTPEAFMTLDHHVDIVHKLSRNNVDAFVSFLVFVDNAFGLSLSKRSDILKSQKEIIANRETARANKDWATSDKLRDELVSLGIGVRDTPSGTVWFRL